MGKRSRSAAPERRQARVDGGSVGGESAYAASGASADGAVGYGAAGCDARRCIAARHTACIIVTRSIVTLTLATRPDVRHAKRCSHCSSASRRAIPRSAPTSLRAAEEGILALQQLQAQTAQLHKQRSEETRLNSSHQ